jgi:autotransporter-associated beta strand protein
MGTPPGKIQIEVTGNPAVLTWTGANGGVWDLNTTDNNWTGGPSNTFYNLDTVTFTNSGATGAVTIAGTVQPVVLNVNNSTLAYTFAGSGAIGGSARLVKNGSGTLTLSQTGANTFTGGTTLNAGTLVIGTSSTALGVGKLFVHGGTLSLPGFGFSNSAVFSGTSTIASTGNVTIVGNSANTFTSTGAATVNISMPSGGFLTIGGAMSGFTGTLAMGASTGMLRLNNTGSANRGSATTLFDLGSATATLANRNGGLTFDLGAVQGGPGTKLQGRQSGSGVTESTYRIGALGTDNTFAGTITHGGDQLGLNLVKVGGGNCTLSGASSFTGALTAQQGRVTIGGAFTCTGAAEVQSGATLALANGVLDAEAVNLAAGANFTGSGTIAGDIINGGTMTCGAGTLTILGDVINNGTVRLTGGATLNAAGSFTNNGVLDLLTGAQALPPNLVHGPSGVVIDSSTLKTAAAARSGNTVTITVGGHSGHTYQLQRSDSLTAPSWSNVGSPAAGATQPDGQPTPLPLSDLAATGAQRFYRVLVAP